MKLVLLAVVALLLLPLFRRLSAKAPEGAEPEDEEAVAKARDASFSLLMRTVVVLEDNAWGACTIDGIREDWRRYASAPLRGFTAIPAGRHRVEAEVDGRKATLDFVLSPGEVLVRRLDRDTMTWTTVEDDAAARIVRAAEGGEKSPIGASLVSYRTTTGIARVKTGKIKSPETELARAHSALASILDRVGEGGATDGLEAEARAAGEALIGVPLVQEQLDALVGQIVDRARTLAGKRAEVARVGLAMLPGERRLLELHRDS